MAKRTGNGSIWVAFAPDAIEKCWVHPDLDIYIYVYILCVTKLEVRNVHLFLASFPVENRHSNHSYGQGNTAAPCPPTKATCPRGKTPPTWHWLFCPKKTFYKCHVWLPEGRSPVFFHSFSVLMVKFQFVNGQIPSSSCLVILPFSSSPTAPSAARNLGRSQIFSAKCPAFDKGTINGGFPGGLLTWMVPSGKRLHSELENHHF